MLYVDNFYEVRIWYNGRLSVNYYKHRARLNDCVSLILI